MRCNDSKLAGFYGLYAFEVCGTVYSLHERWMPECLEALTVYNVESRSHCEDTRGGIYLECVVQIARLLYSSHRHYDPFMESNGSRH